MGGDLTLRGVSVAGVPHGRLTSAPVCSPQLLASRSSSRSWPCATPWFLSGTGTASSTRPPPQVSPLGGTSPAVPFSVLWCRNLPHKAPAWASGLTLAPGVSRGLGLGLWPPLGRRGGLSGPWRGESEHPPVLGLTGLCGRPGSGASEGLVHGKSPCYPGACHYQRLVMA